MEIRKIDAKATYSVRQMVLRKGKPIETCHFEGDFLIDTFHFGLFIKEEIVGVISLYNNRNKIFDTIHQLQIRGMAVLEEYQNQGLGALLVKHIEKIAKELEKSLLWFNAREKAVSFYNKLGYTTHGDVFEIENVGLHYLMYKEI